MATAVVVGTAAAISGPAAPAGADDCPDVEVIFARGTGEAPGVGRVGRPSSTPWRRNWAAAPGQLRRQLPGQPELPGCLVRRGRRRRPDRRHVGALPQTTLVLGGFSQGAAAVSMLAGVPRSATASAASGPAPPLLAAAAARVAAVAVFGNPGVRFGSPLSSAGAFAGRAIDLCAPGDPIEVAGRDRAAHSACRVPALPGAGGKLRGRVGVAAQTALGFGGYPRAGVADTRG